MWWPGMDKDIESKVQECHLCQKQQNTPPKAPLNPWTWPNRPWSRIHIDYAGPLEGHMFLVVIDAHSKWLEVFAVKSANAISTIECLRKAFATHGIPDTIVSDNGTPFVNELFTEFTTKNGVKHITVAPYHPASNGMAERAVQVFKKGFNMFKSGSVATRLSRFLLSYRCLPHTTTGRSPAEMLMGRRLRTQLDSVHPDTASKVSEKQQKQKDYHDKHCASRSFESGDLVYISTRSKDWIDGVIVDKTGPVSYTLELPDGRIIKRHVDHLRKKLDNSCVEQSIPPPPEPVTPIPERMPASTSPVTTARTPPIIVQDSTPTTPDLRRSNRMIKPPQRLGWN